MNNEATTLGAAVNDAYERLCDSQEKERALAERVASEYGQMLTSVAGLVKKAPDALLSEWDEKTLARYFELAVLPLLATEVERDQLTLLADLEVQIDRILESHESQKARRGAQSLFESLILSAEDVERKTCQQILELLARFAEVPPEGVIPPSREGDWRIAAARAAEIMDGADRARLRDILQVGLYREVLTFLQQRENLSAPREIAENLAHILTPVATFASRKGGVGKSMLVYATAAWYSKEHPGARVCIIDLDLSGPVWQYLLFPERDKPSHFLNDLLRLDQGNQKGSFDFPTDITRELIEPFLEESSIKVGETALHLLTVADLPRTNRYLSIAISNNSESCFRFLTQLLTALQPLVDFIIIDNEPGLGSLPLLAHVLATSLPHGCSSLISTPALPDLRGSLFELSDLYLLDRESAMVNRPPLWIVNKADDEAKKFLSAGLKIVDVANQIETYKAIVPERPLVARAVSPVSDQFQRLALPLDHSLLAFSNINNKGTPPLQGALDNFVETSFFKTFMEEIGPAMLPLLTDNQQQEGVANAEP